MNDSSLKRIFGQDFNSVYAERHLTLGINFPIEAYATPVPLMQNQINFGTKS